MAEIRNGMVIDYKDDLWEVVEFLHVKPGKGPAFMRSKLKSLRTGRIIENTFRDSDTFDEVRIERTKKEYLYREGDFFILMDLDKAAIGDGELMMKENMEVTVVSTPDGEILGVDLPITVIQEIAECEPNVKGNTASGGGKVAFTETGLRLMVPFFVEMGDKIKIDTRSGEYIERA